MYIFTCVLVVVDVVVVVFFFYCYSEVSLADERFLYFFALHGPSVRACVCVLVFLSL